jgi:hypothetical protein
MTRTNQNYCGSGEMRTLSAQSMFCVWPGGGGQGLEYSTHTNIAVDEGGGRGFQTNQSPNS